MFDVVIAGGGSAGCVLAARLSEDPDRRVLLLEAGPDYASAAQTPADLIASAYPPRTHDWNFATVDRPGRPSVAIPRGRVIGGSSSTNYCFAARARPADHDRWSELGNDGWSFEEVLPYYREMEKDRHGDARWHGRDGRFEVTRLAWDELPSSARAAGEVMRELGYRISDDINAPDEPGFGVVPLNAVDGVRRSTALSHLADARERPNLTIRGDAHVDRVLVEDGRAFGLQLASGEEVPAREVVLCGGAFGSPTILLRSGIGPVEELGRHGIRTVHEIPGVGRNLTEHPVFWNIYAAEDSHEEVRAIYQSTLSVRIDAAEPDYDVHILPSAIVPTTEIPPAYVPPTQNHPTGFDFVFFVSNVQPRSRGSVTLTSTDPLAAPAIDLALYRDPADARVVADGVHLARSFAARSPLADLLVAERAPGPGVPDSDLEDAVTTAVTHYNHPCGTCRMGPADDPAAVVDPRGRLHGLDGLRVVDASILPTIPRVAINPTTVLVAERIAAWMNEASRTTSPR